jgi:hypothetical protein
MKREIGAHLFYTIAAAGARQFAREGSRLFIPSFQSRHTFRERTADGGAWQAVCLNTEVSAGVGGRREGRRTSEPGMSGGLQVVVWKSVGGRDVERPRSSSDVLAGDPGGKRYHRPPSPPSLPTSGSSWRFWDDVWSEGGDRRVGPQGAHTGARRHSPYCQEVRSPRSIETVYHAALIARTA